MSLDRVERLLRKLGEPQRHLPPVIHIAGTNGKGSTHAMIRAGLEATGAVVHAYTSPHLISFHERIMIGTPHGAQQISECALCELLAATEQTNAGDEITFFEVTTCAAMMAFARAAADYTILEVGMGGRTDATNVSSLAPALSVITPISLDHTEYLGETIGAIAAHKAGIMRPGVVAVIGEQSEEALRVIYARAAEVGCELLVHGRDWSVSELGRGGGAGGGARGLVYADANGSLVLPLPLLLGRHQVQNAGVAIAALRALRFGGSSRGFLRVEALPPAIFRAALQARWPGRLQLLRSGLMAQEAGSHGHEVWVDGGHNPSAGTALAEALGRLPARSVHLVVGMLARKDVVGYLRPLAALVTSLRSVTIEGEGAACDAREIVSAASEVGIEAGACTSPLAAVRSICSAAGSGAPVRIVLCGSLYLVAEALRAAGGELDAGSHQLDWVAHPLECTAEGKLDLGGRAAGGEGGQPDGAAVRHVYLCLGSNLGHRAAHIGSAVQALAQLGSVRKVSALYCTEPQHVREQPDFLNGACELLTDLSPERLLLEVKAIERKVGRTAGGVRYGPRVIDIDIAILGSGGEVVDAQTAEGPLHVPHLQLMERTFMLKPLIDIDASLVHPSTGEPLARAYLRLASTAGGTAGILARLPRRVLPIREEVTWELGRRTYLMGILNVTPDSFSDGGDHESVEDALAAARLMAEAGCDVLDVGAESTRPGADRVSAEEELRRLIPVIKAIRSARGGDKAGGGEAGDVEAGGGWADRLVLSVDTTRAHVAEVAVEAGADIINDISGGTFDPLMIPTVARLQVPYVLMHTRGLPNEMMSKARYDDLLHEVCAELGQRVRIAREAGIPPWRLIIDPGIGFAKRPTHSLQLLRLLPRFVEHFTNECRGGACATLVGASRKGFIGQLLGQPDPKRRQWGNAATVAASSAAGVDVVRVHEVSESRQVAAVADAIHRSEDVDVLLPGKL